MLLGTIMSTVSSLEHQSLLVEKCKFANTTLTASFRATIEMIKKAIELHGCFYNACPIHFLLDNMKVLDEKSSVNIRNRSKDRKNVLIDSRIDLKIVSDDKL